MDAQGTSRDFVLASQFLEHVLRGGIKNCNCQANLLLCKTHDLRLHFQNQKNPRQVFALANPLKFLIRYQNALDLIADHMI